MFESTPSHQNGLLLFSQTDSHRSQRFVMAASRLIVAASVLVLLGLSGLGHGRAGTMEQGHTSLRPPRFLQSDENCTLDCCRIYEDELGSGGDDSNAWVNALPFAVQILLIIFLLAMSALFSGLTLGLMSLDKTGLEIVMEGDDERNANFARRIYPVRKDGNLLLCTLLLGNVAVNALLSILMAEYAGGIIGFLASTFLIVIFGEIVPQAACSRYALRIGSATVPLVRVIRLMLYPVAKPLALCLDYALGEELASTYSSKEIIKLLQIHVQENIIDQETAGAMAGALMYKNVLVKDVMTPLDKTFMLNVDEKLSFETIAKIFRTGYSRIPVYEDSPNNVIGLLFVKDLIFIDPEDDTPLRSFIQIFGRGVHVVWPDDKLGDVLSELKQGRSHLALVRDVNNEDEEQDPFYEVKGIITLEDIIEKIIGDQILDETDAFSDRLQLTKVDRQETFEWARLRLLDSKIVDQHLSPEETKAVVAHLRHNYATTVDRLTDVQLRRLVAETPVSTLPTAPREVGKDLPTDLLYEKNVPIDCCTLVLSGKVTVFVGSENFRSDVSSWSLLAVSALTDTEYVPDFTAYVSDGPCRCLRISHEMFGHALDASALERQNANLKAFDNAPKSIRKHSSQISDTSIQSEPTPVTVTGGKLSRNRRQKFLDAFMTGRSARLIEEVADRQQAGTETVAEASSPLVGFQEGGILDSERRPSSNTEDVVKSVATSGLNVPQTIEEAPSPSASTPPAKQEQGAESPGDG